MAGTFRELSDAFNEAAKSFPRSEDNPDILLTRYSLLLRHKAETDEDRMQIVNTLYECGLQMLRKFTGPRGSTTVYDDTTTNAEAVFAQLSGPESLRCIPDGAPQAMADISFDLLAKAEAANSDHFPTYTRFNAYKAHMTSLAKLALKCADTFSAAIAERTVDIKTSKNIPLARRIVLKSKEEDPGP